MEEDDGSFLDGVIEFEDGRQYKIESADLPSELSLLSESSSTGGIHTAKSRLDGVDPAEGQVSLPVGKKERFVDDFDRSWPRSRTSPASLRDSPLPAGQPPIAVPVPTVITPSLRPSQESSRVLFNERSNKLEPYTNSQKPVSGRYQDLSVSPTEPRSAGSARDNSGNLLSHSNVQVLHKSGSMDQPSRFRRFSGGSSSSVGSVHPSTQTRERDHSARWDGAPPSPLIPKDNFSSLAKDREFHGDKGRRSDMGPPSLPVHTTHGHPGRQIPPHLSQVPPNTAHSQGLRSPMLSHSRPQLRTSSGEHILPNLARLPSHSPASSHASLARISPAIATSSLPHVSVPELDEVQKDVMQSAAARAKQRRQQEEEEREKKKERARRKAAELEEQMKAAEMEKAAVLEQAEQTPTSVINPHVSLLPNLFLTTNNSCSGCGSGFHN